MAIIEPMVQLTRLGGRPRNTDMREEINAIFYIGSTGCRWRAQLKDFLPMKIVHGISMTGETRMCWKK